MPSSHQAQPLVKITPPDWVKDAVIYEINVRQFTPEGTFSAAMQHFPRLVALGVDVLWLMPVHPIGTLHRKGTLGSPYAVKDYYGVNPEFGDMDDFKALVKEAHRLGLKVILDWVANHSAWDNPLTQQHPEWYDKDHNGQFRSTPWWDWSDIIDFDYHHPGLRQYMNTAMQYWVRETDIDGFRCDVAGFVPNDFWAQLRHDLSAIKPVLMLAEWESRELHFDAFDMTYAWSWNETLHSLANGKCSLQKLYKYYAWNEKAFPHEAIRMTFVSNHDKNAWDGTQFEQFGDALPGAIVLSVLGEGMPLIYNGQEAGNPRRLAFFERDPIDWQTHWVGELYTHLIHLKKRYSALHNGAWGARMQQVTNDSGHRVFSFVRHNANGGVLVLINFSPDNLTMTSQHDLYCGDYRDAFSAQPISLSCGDPLSFAPWAYRVLIKE
ncbi:alpha-amylase [Aestuariibacter halophilus]|uniref:Alpha-amylase n=1 Tax=Fluctibacter halophilus TaxID=226011 RepID=A0ABS8G785_9ALTE|nr:alpha-amylase family glycosyl hydrolase [Aestuariibacter halophilus]MCC2616278.1 alpha-amylase [Aestuariibacter halophilus]